VSSHNGNGNGKGRPPYLAVKNWERYQTVKDGRPANYCKLWKAALTDRELSGWSCHLFGTWCRVLLLRLDLGHNLDNDLLWVARQIYRGPHPGGHQNISRALADLQQRGRLVPCFERVSGNFGAAESESESESEYRSTLTRDSGFTALTGKRLRLTPTQVGQLSKLFPMVDLRSEVLKLDAWADRTGIKPDNAAAFVTACLKTTNKTAKDAAKEQVDFEIQRLGRLHQMGGNGNGR
jgi:hypothetical protein